MPPRRQSSRWSDRQRVRRLASNPSGRPQNKNHLSVVLFLARQPECRTNLSYLVDFIPICLTAKLISSAEIRQLYLENSLTAVQIARHFGVSRASIGARLRELGIKEQGRSQSGTYPKNYRQRTPPFGFSLRNGQLIPNKSEIKICRMIVQLVGRDGQKQNAVARELSRKGYKNRAGSRIWNSKTVFNIYRRWKDKL